MNYKVSQNQNNSFSTTLKVQYFAQISSATLKGESLT